MSDPDYTLGLWGELKRSVEDTGRLLRPVVKICFVLGILYILFFSALGPMPGGLRRAEHSASMQTARAIGMAMFGYANDNDGNYPNGKSSTEVFQKLLDGEYISDSTIFYISLPGKTKAFPGQKLKPENVCFDVTSGVDSKAPEGLPLVFMTGYRVNYVPGGAAVPLVKPYPPFWTRTWLGWWRGEPAPPHYYDEPPGPGVAVFYKGNNAKFIDLGTPAHLDDSIPNFVPVEFDAKGKTYRQLTPEGPLPQ